jgi:hypothetical protein
MKKIFVLLVWGIILLQGLLSQVNEYTYDFNDLSMSNLEGQDDWSTAVNLNGSANAIWEVDYMGNLSLVTPDGTLGAFYSIGGPSFNGNTASRPSTDALPFDFSTGGIVEIEVEIILTNNEVIKKIF